MPLDFDRLIENIDRGQMIPFIGNELFHVVHPEEGRLTVERFLTRELSRKLREPGVERLSDIAKIAKDRKEDVYKLIRNIYYEIGVQGRPYDLYKFDTQNIENLIDIDGFKTFFSVSFADILQKKLVAKYGQENVGIFNYSLTNTSVSGKKNLSKELNEKRIVVINLLGCVADGANEFAVTEEEYLEYFFNIISGSTGLITTNLSLANRIKDSGYIYLGCNYPSWYSRYIVRGITQKRFISHSLLDNVFIDIPPMNDVDRKFFENHSSFVVDDTFLADTLADAAGENLTERFIAKLRELIRIKIAAPAVYEGLVFLAYYSGDKQTCEKIDIAIRTERIASWFDIRDLEAGKHEQEITAKINECKVFIPIISPQLLDIIGGLDKIADAMEKENKTPYSARIEWPYAIGRHRNLEKYPRNETYKIIPCLLDGVNRNDERIPKLFRDLAMFSYPAERKRLIANIKEIISGNIQINRNV